MIAVSQGHEKGVGLEVFFKAMLCAPSAWGDQIVLHADKRTVQKHFKDLGIDAEVTAEAINIGATQINCRWLAPSKTLPQSSLALLQAMEQIENQSDGILFTLPTTKDALRSPKHPTKKHLGHTEFLRHHYKTPELGMFFTSPGLHALLLTDHLPLKEVGPSLTAKAFREKLQLAIDDLRTLHPQSRCLVIAGMNPHAGEGGLLGKEELRLMPSLQKLRATNKGIKIDGFYSGDTLLQQRQSPEDIAVYCHHDQGLAPFKALRGTLGANVTLGLPRLRLSVDHGTAFALYGKNNADHRGAYFCLRQAMIYQEHLRGKDHRQQSASS